MRGRPRLCCMDCVKFTLGNCGMTMEAARQCAKIGRSGEHWFTYRWYFCGHFCLANAIFRTAPLRSGVIFNPLRGVGCRYTIHLE